MSSAVGGRRLRVASCGDVAPGRVSKAPRPARVAASTWDRARLFDSTPSQSRPRQMVTRFRGSRYVNPRSAVWLNRLGLFMYFLAVWCVLPVILGERRLRNLEELAAAWIGRLARYAIVAIWAAVAIGVPYWAVMRVVRGGLPVLAQHLEESAGSWFHALLATSAEIGNTSSQVPDVSADRIYSS